MKKQSKQNPVLKNSLNEEDLRILEQIKKGDQRAFEKIFARYYRYIYYKMYLSVQNKQQAQDLTMEIFHKVYVNMGNYKENSSFNSWITSIAKNHLYDYGRKVKSVKRSVVNNALSIDSGFGLPAGSPEPIQIEIVDNDVLSPMEPSHEVIYQNRLASIELAMGFLDEKDRKILQLYYMRDLKYSEISEMLGLNLSTVKLRILRAKDKLKEIVEGINPDLESDINYDQECVL